MLSRPRDGLNTKSAVDYDDQADSEVGIVNAEDEYEEGLLVLGIDYPSHGDLQELLHIAAKNEVHFVCSPLFHPRLRRYSVNERESDPSALITRSDMCLPRLDWVSNVVGKWMHHQNFDALRLKSNLFTGLGSAWPSLELANSPTATMFEQECAYASHLGLQALILPSPPNSVTGSTSATAILSSWISAQLNPATSLTPTGSVQLWLTIPFMLPFSGSSDENRGWTIWNQMRTMAGHPPQLFAVLDLASASKCTEHSDLSAIKWQGEPVKALVIYTWQFGHKVSNKKKTKLVVSLPQYLQRILAHFTKQPINIIVRGKSQLATYFGLLTDDCNRKPKTPSSLGPYLSAIERYWDRMRKPLTLYDRFCMRYRDSLRSPLQPLSVHLDSQTYTIMEQDPIKYSSYEKAISKALERLVIVTGRGKPPKATNLKRKRDRDAESRESVIQQGWASAEDHHSDHGNRHDQEHDQSLLILVAGPGRGPLIAASVRAARSLGLFVRIVAVEKNPNAVVTLRNRVRDEGWNQTTCTVTIHCSDMRIWKPEDHGLPRADMVVSELLGSWGDNEASPECLDVVLRQCVREVTGVCIPQAYTSYIAPVASSRLWNCAKILTIPPQDARAGLHTPYVVELFNHYVTNDAKPLFSVCRTVSVIDL
jgi:protein arginine N-methyltransferase 5